MLKKGDILLVVLVLFGVFLGSVGFKFYKAYNSGDHKVLIIKQEDKLIKEIDLDTVEKPQRVTVSGNYNDIILIEKGRARFEEANCPDTVCVKTGWLNKNGDTAVCLPNKTIIKIQGEKSKVDAVSY